MRLYPLNVGNFKLDGGAMFGVVPKTIWSKTNPADQNNMLFWSAGFVLDQMVFGTTPNIAPPSNLKLPTFNGYSLIFVIFEFLDVSQNPKAALFL